MTALGAAAARVLTRPVVAAALVVTGFAVDRIADPVHNDVPLCPFKAVTGLWCPLCGGLRSAYSMTHLDLAAAVRDNVLLVLALPLLAWFWLDWLRRDRRDQPERRIPRAAIAALWAVAAAFTITRNLPAADFLRPPA